MAAPIPTTRPHLVTGTAEDADAAMLWLRATLFPLKLVDPDLYEKTVRAAPALPVLLAYRRAVHLSQAGPEN